MTVKELMGITHLSRKTITEKIKDFYPELVENGKTINLSECQAITVMEDLRKKGFITPAQNAQVPAKNAQVDTEIAELKSMVGSLVQAVQAMLTAVQKATSLMEPEYYEVLGYSLKKGLKLSDWEISLCGKLAKRMSVELGFEVRQNPHPRWGTVGCYHVTVLDEVFAARERGNA